MKKFVFILFFFTIMAELLISHAQINTPTSLHQSVTEYSLGNQDPVYFYNSEADIQLLCEATGIDITYNWQKYNSQTNNWEDITATSQTLTNITEGGYKVVVSKNSIVDTSFVCWVFVPQATGNPTVETNIHSCNSPIDLTVNNVDLKELQYFDLSASNQSLTMPYQYRWQLPENDIDTIISGEIFKTKIYFSEDSTKLKLPELSVGIGKNNSDSTLAIPLIENINFSVEGYHVKALFRQTLLNDTTIEDSKEIDPEESALLIYDFVSIEVNNLGNPLKTLTLVEPEKNPSFEWTVYKYGEGDKDIVIPSNLNAYGDDFTFKNQGTYYVSLTVSNGTCEDTYSTAGINEITVSETEMKIPNVFTPNGDGDNETFKVAYKSVKKFEMVIVNRWGRRLFYTTNPDDGWDGKIRSGNAPPDVYYYSVVWEGYDGTKGKKKGFLHLLRDRR